MKKKLLSMLLISAMCLSTAGDTVLAASADFELDVQAENEDFLTGSVELTDGTDEDSEVSEPGAPDDGNSIRCHHCKTSGSKLISVTNRRIFYNDRMCRRRIHKRIE